VGDHLTFSRTNTQTGADSLDELLKDCSAKPANLLRPDFVDCRKASEAFLEQVLALPAEDQRRHLDKTQQVNDASVRKSRYMPQLNIVFSESTGSLSDFRVIVPDEFRTRELDIFDP